MVPTCIDSFPCRFHRIRTTNEEMDEIDPSKNAFARTHAESRLCFVVRQSGRPEPGRDELRLRSSGRPLAMEGRRSEVPTVSHVHHLTVSILDMVLIASRPSLAGHEAFEVVVERRFLLGYKCIRRTKRVTIDEVPVTNDREHHRQVFPCLPSDNSTFVRRWRIVVIRWAAVCSNARGQDEDWQSHLHASE